MILFFSGTGNSAFAARKIAELTKDECIDLFDKIKNHNYQKIYSQKPFVVVCPTYGWQIPRILRDWIKRTPLMGNSKIYFVMTCGGGIGNAGYYLEQLCMQKKLTYMGCAELVMPENYVAMFSVPDEAQAKQIIQKALPEMEKAAVLIKNGKPFPKPNIHLLDRFSSGAVNRMFYPLFVHAKKFYVKDTCVGCGKCAKVCPLNNIHMSNRKPVWGDNCTHCMACICKCPQEAIEYGKKSQGKPRYQCPGC